MADNIEKEDLLNFNIRGLDIPNIEKNPIHDIVIKNNEILLQDLLGDDLRKSINLFEAVAYIDQTQDQQIYLCRSLFIVWIFQVDDYFDVEHRTKEYLCEMIGERHSAGNQPIDKVFNKFVALLKSIFHEKHINRLFESMKPWIERSSPIDKDISKVKFSDYLKYRSIEGACDLSVLWIDIMNNIDITEKQFDEIRIIFEKFKEIFIKYIILVGDLFSFRKEVLNNETLNAIYLKVISESVSAQTAVDMIVVEVNECVYLIEYYGQQLIKFNFEYFNVYVKQVKVAVPGYVKWSSVAQRFNF